MDDAPTKVQAHELQTAYEFYNKNLFGGELPDCLISYTRNPKTAGHYCHERWQDTSTEERKADEICLNVEILKRVGVERVLSTLVHEMVHCWQQHFGKAPRAGYHNRQWANRMDEVGLSPSGPGGKRTGQKMSHEIEEGGPFDRTTNLLIEAGFTLTWASPPKLNLKKPSSKLKYICPGCETNVWGKPNLSITCQSCDQDFEEQS